MVKLTNLIQMQLQRSAWLARRCAIVAILKRRGARHANCALISEWCWGICWGWIDMVLSRAWNSKKQIATAVAPLYPPKAMNAGIIYS